VTGVQAIHNEGKEIGTPSFLLWSQLDAQPLRHTPNAALALGRLLDMGSIHPRRTLAENFCAPKPSTRTQTLVAWMSAEYPNQFIIRRSANKLTPTRPLMFKIGASWSRRGGVQL
jgi:hypothetical protein